MIKDFFSKKNLILLAVFFVAGLLLVLFSGGGDDDTSSVKNAYALKDGSTYEQELEQRLTKILSGIRGAGTVRVMVCVRGGPVTVYLTDDTIQNDGASTKKETSAVFARSSSSVQNPVESAVVYPEIIGVAVVATGAENANIRLSMINTVAAVLGLSTSKISVTN